MASAMASPYTEDQLVEQSAIGLFAVLCWQLAPLPLLLSGQINVDASKN